MTNRPVHWRGLDAEQMLLHLEEKKNVRNLGALRKKMRHDKANVRSLVSELKAIYLFSQINGVVIDCAGKLQNDKNTDALIIFDKALIFVEVYSPWKEGFDFMGRIKTEGVTGIRSIAMLLKETEIKYCEKHQFSKNHAHLFVVDIDDSMTDVFQSSTGVSDFSKAYSCKMYPSGDHGLFHKISAKGDHIYENITAAVAMREGKIVEIIVNPNAKNPLTTEFLERMNQISCSK